MEDAISLLQIFIDALSPVFAMTIVIGLALSISHGMINWYKGFL